MAVAVGAGAGGTRLGTAREHHPLTAAVRQPPPARGMRYPVPLEGRSSRGSCSLPGSRSDREVVLGCGTPHTWMDGPAERACPTPQQVGCHNLAVASPALQISSSPNTTHAPQGPA